MQSFSGGDRDRRKSSVLDGSNIMKLVGNEQVFSSFVDHKFQELDKDGDGKLSVKELQPAVADIGAALGLPAKGSSSHSDLIYSQVLNEFTQGKKERISKAEFKKALTDFLLGMAAGLKREPIVILRMDGKDLIEFLNGPTYEPEIASIFSKIHSPNASFLDHIIQALAKLTVDQGLPPTSDSWVVKHIVEPALQSQAGPEWDKPVSQEAFLVEFKKVALVVAELLGQQPVIVAHSENAFDGSGIKALLSNKLELEKTLNSALEGLPRDHSGKISKEYLRVALDVASPSSGLPPLGGIDEMDKVVGEVFKMVNADDGKMVKEDEFKNILTEILATIMLQLEGNPISTSSNSVVHEPLGSSSTLLQPPSAEAAQLSH